MRTELISIETDTLPLDGAWYEPDGGTTAGAVMLCHGNSMNFYVGAPRFLPPTLTGLGYACLAFNRRGHDILSIRDSRAAEGFGTACAGPCDIGIVPDCDHFYKGREDKVTEIVAGWLKKTLP